MNIINIEHVTKIYGDKRILDDVSYGIQEGDRIGIVGINGTGKTTLLRLIAGMEETDAGQVTRQNNSRIAWLPQNPEYPAGETVLSYTAGDCSDDWSRESNAKSVLMQLGLQDFEEKLENLSGGQRKRAALAAALLSSSEILILDEPTNHLDSGMVSWLEEYLRKFRGTLIMVTHDRYFLDQVANRILEITHGSLYGYDANYSRFLELKAEREEMELASERKRQSILRMEIEWAKRGCRARTTKQKARLERLELLRNASGPVRDTRMELDSIHTRMGKKTLELHHVTKRFGEKLLIQDFDYIVLKNQRLGFIGPNGCGKSTLLKIMAGMIPPDEGTVEVGETVKIGYFAQDVPFMDPGQRVIDFVRDIAEYIPTRDGRITASQMLERFLFTPDMQYAPIGKLSGGERKRLYLLSILQSAPNLLILDECSNDLDIPTLTILEDYLNSFSGIIVMVSHDRYFLDNVVDRIFEFDGCGRLIPYEGGYTDYLEAKRQRFSVQKERTAGERSREKKNDSGREHRQNSSGTRTQKLRFTFKEQREYETIDEEIAALEEKLSKIEEEILRNATNSGKLNELMQQKAAVEETLEEKMDRWVYLNDLAERIAAGS